MGGGSVMHAFFSNLTELEAVSSLCGRDYAATTKTTSLGVELTVRGVREVVAIGRGADLCDAVEDAARKMNRPEVVDTLRQARAKASTASTQPPPAEVRP